MDLLKEDIFRINKLIEDTCKWHKSPSGKVTNMCPDDDDYEINYGENSGEIGEQEEGGSTPPPSSSSGGSTSSAKSWESGRKMGKTYGGHGYVWNSDRSMGKTYMGDPKYKWDSGASRGKANPLT